MRQAGIEFRYALPAPSAQPAQPAPPATSGAPAPPPPNTWMETEETEAVPRPLGAAQRGIGAPRLWSARSASIRYALSFGADMRKLR